MKLFITDWQGNIYEAEGVESDDWYDVSQGPQAGRYFKIRLDQDFHLSRERAEIGAIDKVKRQIARAEFDLDRLKKRLVELKNAKK